MRRIFGMSGFLLSVPALALAEPISLPDAAHSFVEPVLVASSSGQVIGDGFRVIVRDQNGLAMPGVTVDVVFPVAGPHAYTTQPPPMMAYCSTHLIRATAGVDGSVEFHPRAGGFANTPVVTVKANGIALGQAAVRSTDMDADGDTDIHDFSIFRADFLGGASPPEADFDEVGGVGIGDFYVFRTIFLNDVPGTICP